MREYLKFYIDGKWVDPVELEDPERRKPGDRAGVRQDRARFGRRCGQGGQGRPQGLRDLVADQPRGAARGPAAHPRRIPEARRRSRPRRSPKRWARRPRSPTAFRSGSGLGHLTTAIEVLKTFQVRGAARRDADREGADRRLRPDHAVELADEPDRRQGLPGAGDRLHHGAQALRSRTVLGPDLRRDPARRRRSRRRVQPVQGDGPGVGVAMSSHPDIDMISFTGSTRAGIEIAKNAAPTVKRVAQELGGKSPNIILDDAAFASNVAARRRVDDGQLRPDLQRALAHARAAARAWTKPSDIAARGRGKGDRGRPQRQCRDGPGGLQEPSSTRSRR